MEKKLVIKPFKATFYNPKVVKNYSSVTCPPYDVISSAHLKSLRKRSKYNFSKVLIADKGYEAAGNLMQKWIKDKVLIDDDKDCLYLYEQKFKVEGKACSRFGILSLLKMSRDGIFPHEYTLKGPKEDRKKIIRATKANLSPIFVIAAKSLESFKKAYKKYSKKKPFLKFNDDDGNSNSIWRIDDKKDINSLSSQISKAKLVIADGHHRFEISYDYFKKNKNRFKDLDYVLAYVADKQKGLNILPTHRIAKIKDSDQVFFKKLEKYFDISKVSQCFIDKKLKTAKEFCLGIYRSNKFYFLKLKSKTILDKIPNKSYRALDTYVFHKLFLPFLGAESSFEYSHNVGEAKLMTTKGKTAILMRNVSLDAVLKISSEGFKLPQKSTYFYPKVFSGGIIRRFLK